jgi:hypothetical protein
MNDKSRYYKILFTSAAVWNWFATVAGLRTTGKIKTDGESRLYTQSFFSFVFIFGIGYWLVSRDPERNRTIVKLGLVGKTTIFLLSLRYVTARKVPPIVLLAGVIDLIYAGLFAEFLRNKKA